MAWPVGLPRCSSSERRTRARCLTSVSADGLAQLGGGSNELAVALPLLLVWPPHMAAGGSTGGEAAPRMPLAVAKRVV